MLGLQFITCEQCGTVSAVPEESRRCARCGHDAVETVDTDPRTAAYFAPAAQQ